MILCVTPNPALDRILVTPDFHAGRVYRVNEYRLAAGGKGLNVARSIKRLAEAEEASAQAVCAGFLGGRTGRWVAELAEADGLEAAWTWIEGETRTCVIVTNPENGETTVLNEAGPQLVPADWSRLCDEVSAVAAKADLVCLSGSLPPGLPPDSLGRLVGRLQAAGRRPWVDAAGESLRTAIEAHPALVKVNVAEGCGVLGRGEAKTVAEALDAGQRVRTLGAGPVPMDVVLTWGAAGALALTGEGLWFCQPPATSAVSNIGCGDAFFAGLAVARLAGAAWPEALRRATAAGTANTLVAGGGQFTLKDYSTLLEKTQVKPLLP